MTVSSSKEILSHSECAEFIRIYLQGILEQGLLLPLQEISRHSSGRIAMTARSWFELQVRGLTPQGALVDVVPGFPLSVARVLSLGFEKSVLDVVLGDLVKLYSETVDPERVDVVLQELLLKYAAYRAEVICVGCWQDELAKVVARAAVEGASQVMLEQEGEEFLHQKYLAVKCVRVTEPAISAVYGTLLRILGEVASSGVALRVGEREFQVAAANEGSFLLASGEQKLQVTFASRKR